ncbi:MAG: hypothetical protein AAGI06_02505 [Pseudomonadota bacterium]
MTTVSVPKDALAWSLFGLRLGVFVVLAMWTLNKFVNPVGTAAVFERFYGISGLSEFASYATGALQGVVIIAFLVGFQKRWAIAIVFVMHLVSTLSSMGRYLDPWASPNLLFFAAWPMLTAIIALYLLRDYDTKFALGASDPKGA